MKHQLVNSTTSTTRFFFTAICALSVLLLCCSFSPPSDDLIYWGGENELEEPIEGYSIQVNLDPSWQSQHPEGILDVELVSGQLLTAVYSAPGLVQSSDIGYIASVEITLPLEQGHTHPEIKRFFITHSGSGILTIVLDNL